MTPKAIDIMFMLNTNYDSERDKLQLSPHPYMEESAQLLAEIKAGRWAAELAEIKEHMRDEHARHMEREAKINAIEGLDELRAAIDDIARYRREFDAMMDDEFNDGVFPPVLPPHDINALKAKYPRAAAYLAAERFAESPNYSKAKYGAYAIDRLIDGDDPAEAISEMSKSWSDYCLKNVWD